MAHHSKGRTIVVLVALASMACLAASSTNAVEMQQRTVFVPGAVIYPGDVIAAESLISGKVARAAGSPAVFGENIEDLVGKVARRTLMRGELIPNSAVREQALVVQGRTYKLTYSSPFVTIVGTGIPMKSAAIGEWVAVRNPDTGLIIQARVQADQTLAVDEQ